MTDSAPETNQDPSDGDETPTVADDVGDLLTAIRSHRRRFSRAKNLLKPVDGKSPQPADFEDWLAAVRGLEGYELGVPEVDDKRQKVVDRLGSVLDRLRIKARMKFTTKLEMLADRRELDIEKISENPLVVYIEPLTFEVDFDEGGVEMLYGKEAIGSLPIDAGRLIDAHTNTAEAFDDEEIPSAEFFDLLEKAYRMVLATDGAEPGERVDLVDVLVPISMLLVERGTLRKKGPEALEPFPRYRLARQLQNLRRDGLLEKNGVRLELGAATGGSTRDKADVLYVPVGSTGGQYYGSLRFE